MVNYKWMTICVQMTMNEVLNKLSTRRSQNKDKPEYVSKLIHNFKYNHNVLHRGIKT